MPMYDCLCSAGHRFERMIKLADFADIIVCDCQMPAKRLISKPRISVEDVGYDCPISGKWIGSKRDHEENLRANDCHVYETGEREESMRRRSAADDSFERSVDETVERVIDQMPGDKREKLANELLAGADLSVDRGTAQ